MTAKPSDLTRVWANGAASGDVVDPDVADPGKFDLGWGAEKPPYQYFNFIQKLLTQGLAHSNEYGIMQWDSTTDYPVGGWARSTVDDEVYVSLVNPNTNNEPSASPTEWTKLKDFFATGEMTTTVFSTSGTYNPPAGVKSIEVWVIGAGGGSGGVAGSGAGTGASSVAGAGGGTAVSVISGSNIESSYTVTIGASGAGGAAGNNPGSAGGNSSFVGGPTNMSATGGEGGAGRTASAGVTLANGAEGGIGTGGNFYNLKGGGTMIAGAGGGGGPLAGGPGGESYLGQGGRPILGASATASGIPGAGGGSTSVFNTSSNFSGASGGNGRVIIREYF